MPNIEDYFDVLTNRVDWDSCHVDVDKYFEGA